MVSMLVASPKQLAPYCVGNTSAQGCFCNRAAHWRVSPLAHVSTLPLSLDITLLCSLTARALHGTSKLQTSARGRTALGAHRPWLAPLCWPCDGVVVRHACLPHCCSKGQAAGSPGQACYEVADNVMAVTTCGRSASSCS